MIACIHDQYITFAHKCFYKSDICCKTTADYNSLLKTVAATERSFEITMLLMITADKQGGLWRMNFGFFKLFACLLMEYFVMR